MPDAIEVSGPLRSNNALALRIACRAGAGIGLLPEFVTADDVRAGTLRHLLPQWTAAEQGIYAVYPRAAPVPAKVRRFVDFVRGYVAR